MCSLIQCETLPPCCAVEDQNFALFNYVNELNGDIELIMEQIQQVRDLRTRGRGGR